MPRTVEVNGVRHVFPDGATDDDISSALSSYDAGMPSGTKPIGSDSPAALANKALKQSGISVSAPKAPLPAPGVLPKPVGKARKTGVATDPFYNGADNALSEGGVRVAANTADLASNLVQHPIDALSGIITAPFKGAKNVVTDISNIKSKDPNAEQDVDTHLAEMFGINANQVREDALNKNYGGIGGEAGSAILNLLALKKGSDIVGGMLPRKAPIVLTPEEVSRQITRAVNVADRARPKYITNVTSEQGNIVDFARRNNMPLETNLDWVKAARGAAEERNAYFNAKFMQPNENVIISDPPLGYKGERFADRSARLGDIFARAKLLSEKMRSIYDAKSSGQVIEGLADEAAINAEKKALNKVLYDELSKRSGVAADDIRGLRRSFGRQYDIADKSEAALNARERGVDISTEGRTTPTSKTDILSRAWTEVRGGPEKIANKRLVKALKGVTAQPTGLPEVKPPAPFAPATRTPLWNEVTGRQRSNAPIDMDSMIEAIKSGNAARQGQVPQGLRKIANPAPVSGGSPAAVEMPPDIEAVPESVMNDPLWESIFKAKEAGGEITDIENAMRSSLDPVERNQLGLRLNDLNAKYGNKLPGGVTHRYNPTTGKIEAAQ